MIAFEPFAMMRLTHEAIGRGLDKLEQALDAEGAAHLPEMATAFDEVARGIRLHARQEEQVLFPALARKRPRLAVQFTEEHAVDLARLQIIQAEFAKAAADEEAVADLAELLRLWAASHREHLQHEERVISPALREVFRLEEATLVVRAIMEYDLPEYRSTQLRWVFQYLRSEERGVYLAMLQGCSPPEELRSMLRVVAPLVTAEERRMFQAEGLLGV